MSLTPETWSPQIIVSDCKIASMGVIKGRYKSDVILFEVCSVVHPIARLGIFALANEIILSLHVVGYSICNVANALQNLLRNIFNNVSVLVHTKRTYL